MSRTPDIFGTVTDNEDSYNTISWRLLSSPSKKIDCCLEIVSQLEPSLVKELIEFLAGPEKSRTLQIRVITNITKDNLSIFRQFMKYSDLYHIEGLAGNFYIIDDTAYLYEIEETDQDGKIFRRLMYSTHPQFIKMQQHLFENLLSRAVPAKDKIKQIDKGSQSEFIETIQDSSASLQLAKHLIESASFEILVLFSTINSFYRAENEGLLDLLGKASSRGTNIRVLIKIDDETMKDVSKQKIKEKHEMINVNFIEKSVRSRITTIIIDQIFSLAMEVSDDSRSKFSEATGFSTYSNSESTVFTYFSLFENLWIQAELERQGKVKHAYFRMFKGQKLKDEIYTRRWTQVDDNQE